MKTIRGAFLAIAIVLVATITASTAQAAVSFSLFYSNLSPHGSWLVSAQYGRVWQPGIYRAGWNPYYDGRWIYADVGWTWVSDYGWGDVPYHYGTWYDDPALGWVWVPGYAWAPAWVVFRTGPDYVGWAPVAPGYSVGASLSYGSTAGPFVFVAAGHFCDARVRRYAIPAAETRTIVNQTRIVNSLTIENNIIVNRGPDPRLIEHASGRSVRAVSIESVPHAAPGDHVRRADLAVDPQGISHGVRAAQPVPGRQPLPRAHGHVQGNGNPGAARVSVAASSSRASAHATMTHASPARTRPGPQHPAPLPASGASHGKPAAHGKPHGGNPHDGKQNS